MLMKTYIHPDIKISDDDYRKPSRMDIAQMEADNYDCEIDIADSYTLQIDLDCDKLPDDIFIRLARLDQVLMLLDKTVSVTKRISTVARKSRSGNWHVIINLNNPLPIRTRIMLQMLMGSDIVREYMNVLRVLKCEENPILLYKVKNATMIDLIGMKGE